MRPPPDEFVAVYQRINWRDVHRSVLVLTRWRPTKWYRRRISAACYATRFVLASPPWAQLMALARRPIRWRKMENA
ncbi:hypothetical protein KCP74_14955 [Salmonella enterica subsp. enterica]|nr:hypothetical protein KCP74_14955 [Salmonella enterica subsp. enterica]